MSSSSLRPFSAGVAVRPAVLLQPSLSFRRLSFSPSLSPNRLGKASVSVAGATAAGNPGPQQSKNPKESKQATSTDASVQEEEEVEEDLPWIHEKALDLVEFTGTVTQAVPGPRVGQSKLPWILAVPLAWVGLSFVIGFVKAVKKFTSPRAQRKRLVFPFISLLNQSIDMISCGCLQPALFLWTVHCRSIKMLSS